VGVAVKGGRNQTARIFGPGRRELVGQEFQRVIPRKLFPAWVYADAFRAIRAHQRRRDALGVVEIHQGCVPLGANLAIAVRAIRVAFYFGNACKTKSLLF